MVKGFTVTLLVCLFVASILAAGAFAAADKTKSNIRSVSSLAPAPEIGALPSVPYQYPSGGIKYTTSCDDIVPEAGTIIQHDQIGNTWYDFQKNGSVGRMISVTSSGYQHFSWMYTSAPFEPPTPPRYVMSNCKNPAGQYVGAYPADGGSTKAGYSNQTQLHTGESVIIYHRGAGTPTWNSALTVEDTNCGNAFARKFDVPDVITGAASGEEMMWPKGEVLYNSVDGRDYIHIVGTEGNTAGGVPVMVAYVRCYVKDGPGTFDTLVSQCYNAGATQTYKNIAGNYASALATITHFDSSCSITPVVVVSPVSRRVAIAFLKPACDGSCDYLSDVCYIESMNNGDDWVAGAAGYWQERNLTNYGCSGTERAASDLNACYDYQDSLHIVFVTAGFDVGNPGYYQPEVARLYHWSKASGNPPGTPNMIAYKIQENCHPGGHNINIAKMSISAKDPIYHPGGDSVYLFTIWTQFDSLDQASSKARPYGNGDLWGSGSYSGGKSWGNVYNLTNTKTPGCTPGTCLSEHWSSLAQNMYNGDLHIQYICDRDPGFAQSGQDDGSTWQDNPVMYLHLGEWSITGDPRGAYQIISPDRWLKPPLKVAPNGNKVLTFKEMSIGNANLIYSVASDDPCIQVSVPPTALPPGAFATVTVNVIGTGACNNSFIDGNVIITTNEAGGKTDYLPVQAVVANDYYECPFDPETYVTLENGVLRLYANANGQMRIYDIGTRPDTAFEIFYNGGTIIATTQSGDTLVGRYMGQNDQHAGARDRLHLAEYSDHWTVFTENIFIHDLNPPMNPRWWWWEMSKRIVFFKSNAEDDLKHGVIEYVTVERHDPPAWWPTQPSFTGYEDTYIGMAMDIDCPWDTSGQENGRNLAGYDATNNIAWQRGWDYTGAHPEYNNYYAGMALANGGQPGESTTPYGTYNVKNNHYLYPQGGWGWKDGELYHLAKNNINGQIQDPDSIVDRTQVFTARKINAGTDPNASYSFTVVKAVAYNGLDQLKAYVDSARAAAAYNWTILVYLNGDNNLESAAINDINEMEMVGSSARVNIVVQVDRIPGWDASNGNWTDTRRYYIVNDSDPNVINSIRLDTLPPLGELNMGDPQTLVNFVNWGIDNYPANHYAVVVWDHGDGWYKKPFGEGFYQDDILLKGMSWDDTDGDNIGVSNGEWESAISQIKNHLRRKVELVGFDACLMQMWEVMDITDEYADYMVGSEETENWDGWNYTQFLSALTTNPTMSPRQLGKEIVDAAVDGDGESTQSCVDLARVSALTTAVDDFASELLVEIEDCANDTIVRGIRSQLNTFDIFSHIDLYDFASYVNNDIRLPTSLRNAANVVMTSVNNAVTWNRFQPAYNWVRGIAIYYPRDPSFYDNRYNNLPVASNTLWDNFIGLPLSGVDLALEMWGAPRARPGFSKTYWVRYINRGSSAVNVVLTVILPSEVQYSACNPPDCNVNGQNISWNLGTVGSCLGWVRVDFYIPPQVLPGTVLSGEAVITTTSLDVNLRNNRVQESEVVVTSRDPNDKEAQPWGSGLAHFISPDQTITYSIFFENDSSATAEAIYIDIVDTLDANLDWSTLEFGPMSHPVTCQANFDPVSGVLTWHCDSIMLPPNHNPPEGEGFVGLSIKPDSGLAFGTQIKNRAYIRFDFNPWIAAPDSGPVVRTIGLYGDANGDGVIDVADVLCLINYLFKNGPEPNPLEAGDVNCDGVVNVGDVLYLINYLFKNGPPPSCN